MIKTSAFGSYCVAFFCFGTCVISLANLLTPDRLSFLINSLTFLLSITGLLVFLALGYHEENE
jgi:hypothetical protein